MSLSSFAKKSPQILLGYAKEHRRSLFAIGVILIVAWLVSALATPFSGTVRQAEFFTAADGQKQTSIRAKVLEKNGDDLVLMPLEGVFYEQRVTVKSTYIVDKSSVGDIVLVDQTKNGELATHAYDLWRVPGVVWIAAAFLVIAIIISHRRAAWSLAGLAVTVGVIVFGVIPAILAGVNALLVCAVGAIAIGIASVFVAHGMNRRAAISSLIIVIMIGMVAVIAMIAGWLTEMTGVYDETSSLLSLSNSTIDLYGVLIGGIILATLGVLDDVVTTQVAAVDEIHAASSKRMTFLGLYQQGMSVGNEHIAALINTLVLAYVGIALPTVLSLTANYSANGVSWLMLLNSEFIAQEIVRTLVSSIGLVLAVPLSTALAACVVMRANPERKWYNIFNGKTHKKG